VLYSVLPSIVLGFHGCDKAVADRAINRRRPLRYSRNEYDWLGSGIYFWENDPRRAMEWARDLKRRDRIRTPAVVGAIIDLGRCLNLLDRRYADVLKRSYGDLVRSARKTGEPLPANRSLRGSRELVLRDLDCAVINAVHESSAIAGLPPYDTVRAAFIEGDEMYPTSAFRNHNHIQVCVRTPRSIKGYFHPLAEPRSVTAE
jgi:hypothetical protein